MKQYIVDKEKKDIVEQDWNFLVIMDTCRYDIFKDDVGKYIVFTGKNHWIVNYG